MKIVLAMLAMLAVAVAGARAADDVLTNYVAGYVGVSATSTNAGDTGLATNTAYLAFPLSAFSANLSTARMCTATGSFSQVVFALTQGFYSQLAAATNPPTGLKMGRQTIASERGDFEVVLQVRAVVTVTGAQQVVGE
jgi:hypothetical protein